jgi:hypothetical protein
MGRSLETVGAAASIRPKYDCDSGKLRAAQKHIRRTDLSFGCGTIMDLDVAQKGSVPHRVGAVTSTFFQVWSGLNDVIRSAILSVRSPRSFWKTVPA